MSYDIEDFRQPTHYPKSLKRGNIIEEVKKRVTINKDFGSCRKTITKNVLKELKILD
ncbi:MAG: hypothetical protein U0457_10000 [Candidatus Sericytochromatia bacterium]